MYKKNEKNEKYAEKVGRETMEIKREQKEKEWGKGIKTVE